MEARAMARVMVGTKTEGEMQMDMGDRLCDRLGRMWIEVNGRLLWQPLLYLPACAHQVLYHESGAAKPMARELRQQCLAARLDEMARARLGEGLAHLFHLRKDLAHTMLYQKIDHPAWHCQMGWQFLRYHVRESDGIRREWLNEDIDVRLDAHTKASGLWWKRHARRHLRLSCLSYDEKEVAGAQIIAPIPPARSTDRHRRRSMLDFNVPHTWAATTSTPLLSPYSGPHWTHPTQAAGADPISHPVH